MGRNDWEKEIDLSLRKENWSLVGPNRLVKVVILLPTGAGNMSMTDALGGVGGYVTQAKFIAGLTCSEIEEALGLERESLKFGAVIHTLARLPAPTEYTYELTAEYPDGMVYNPAMSNEDYPPGSAKIHQWEIRKDVAIPVCPKSLVRLAPGQRFAG